MLVNHEKLSITFSLLDDRNHIQSYDELRIGTFDAQKVEEVFKLQFIDYLNIYFDRDFSLFETVKISNKSIDNISIKIIEHNTSAINWTVEDSVIEILIFNHFPSMGSIFNLGEILPDIITDFLYLYSNLPNYHVFVLNEELKELFDYGIDDYKYYLDKTLNVKKIDNNTSIPLRKNYDSLSEFIDKVQDNIHTESSKHMIEKDLFNLKKIGIDYFKIKSNKNNETLVEKDINGFAIPRSDEASPAEEIYTITRTIRLLGGQYENY